MPAMPNPEGLASTQIALIMQRLDQIDQKLDGSLHDHEERLRRMERWMYALPASLVTALISIGLALFSTYHSHP